MTDEEIEKILEEMKKMFGDELPNFEHYPRSFAYYVKLYLHCKKHGY
jgi:hypothetical protein